MIWRCAVPGPGVVNGATLCRGSGRRGITQPTDAARTRIAQCGRQVVLVLRRALNALACDDIIIARDKVFE